ncbi:hypothetical protein D9M71_155530 [compost metagenome]
MQVTVVQACLAKASIQVVGKTFQAWLVQARHENGPLFILEETAVLLGDGRAFGGADAKHQKLSRFAVERVTNAQPFLFGQGRTDQQDPAVAQRRLFEQRQRLEHRQIGAMPGLWHQRRLQCVQQIAAGGQIIRQRYQRVGTAGVDDDGGLRVAANLQQIKHLASCLFESVGCDVGGEHFRGQLENHHQRVGGLLTGLLDTLPARTEQGEHGQQPCQTEGDPGQFTVTATAATEQCGVKGRWQNHLPAPGALLAVPELPEQPAKHRQQQQPPGAEPVRPQRTHRRLRRRRRLRR